MKIRFFVIMLPLLMVCVCAAQATGWRIASRVSESSGIEFSPFVPEGFTGFTDRVEETVLYDPLHYDVLYKVLGRDMHTGANGDGEWHTHPQILNTAVVSEQIPGYRTVYSYFGNGEWYRQRVETTDSLGRLVHLTSGNGTMPTSAGRRIHYYYDAEGRLDYLQVVNFANNQAAFFQRVMQYDQQGRKIGEMVYTAGEDSSSWTPFQRVTVYQSGRSFPAGTVFHRQNILFDIQPAGYAACYDLINLPGLTETGIVDSVHVEEMIDGEWSLTDRDVYEVQISPSGDISFSIISWYLPMVGIPDYFPGQYSFSFASHGGFLGYSFSYDDGLSPPSWGSVSYNWEEVSDGDDPLSPAPAHELIAYPNPFRDKLSLELKGQGGEGTEIGIYNLRGQRIRTYRGIEKILDWDGKDEKGYAVPAGIYLINRDNGGKSACIKVLKY